MYWRFGGLIYFYIKHTFLRQSVYDDFYVHLHTEYVESNLLLNTDIVSKTVTLT